MVQTAVTDVERPTVAAENPDGLLRQVGLVLEDFLGELGRFALAGGDGGKLLDEHIGGFASGMLVAASLKPRLGGVGNVGLNASRDELLGVSCEHVVHGLVAKQHTHAVLGVVLEQRVRPRRAMALLVHRVRRRSRRSTPNRRTTRGVGDVHMVAVELRDKTRVRRLCATGAGARELKQRLLELAAAQGLVLDRRLVGNLGHAVVENALLSHFALGAHHGKRVEGTSAYAHAAAHAVERGNRERVLQVFRLALHGQNFQTSRRCGDFFVGQAERANSGMRTHERAAVALGALLGIPLGNGDGNAALFEAEAPCSNWPSA